MEADRSWPTDHLSEVIAVADRALMAMHVPLRPSWACMACANPWPCLIARVTLADQLGHVLRDAMATYAAEARVDLEPYGTSRDQLYQRFMRWINVPERAAGSAPVQPRAPRRWP